MAPQLTSYMPLANRDYDSAVADSQNPDCSLHVLSLSTTCMWASCSSSLAELKLLSSKSCIIEPEPEHHIHTRPSSACPKGRVCPACIASRCTATTTARAMIQKVGQKVYCSLSGAPQAITCSHPASRATCCTWSQHRTIGTCLHMGFRGPRRRAAYFEIL